MKAFNHQSQHVRTVCQAWEASRPGQKTMPTRDWKSQVPLCPRGRHHGIQKAVPCTGWGWGRSSDFMEKRSLESFKLDLVRQDKVLGAERARVDELRQKERGKKSHPTSYISKYLMWWTYSFCLLSLGKAPWWAGMHDLPPSSPAHILLCGGLLGVHGARSGHAGLVTDRQTRNLLCN